MPPSHTGKAARQHKGDTVPNNLKHPVLAKWALLLVSILSIMAGTSLAPALPIIQDAFAGQANVEMLTRLVQTTHALFIVLAAPLAGAAADRFGRKKLLVFALGLYAVSGVSGYFAGSLASLLAGRALLGVAIAISATTATALIADYFEGPERASLMGLQMASTTVGAVICLALGGYLADIGWREPFLIYLFAALLLPLAILVLSEPAHHGTPHRGAANIAGRWLIGIVLVVAFLGSVAMYSIAVQVPFYLREVFHLGGFGTGLVIASGTVFATLASLGYARTRRHAQYPGLFAASFLLMGVGFLLVGWADSVPMVIAGLCMTGASTGLQMPTLNNWLADLAPTTVRGKVLGALTTALFLGQFVSPLVLTPLLARLSYSAFFAALGLAALMLWLVLLAARGVLTQLSAETERQARSGAPGQA